MITLRTVPPFATAQTLCTAQEGLRGSDFLRTVPTNILLKGIFSVVNEYMGKEGLLVFFTDDVD